MPKALPLLLILTFFSCKVKYQVNNHQYKALYHDNVNVTTIIPNKYNEPLTAFFITDVNNPSPDSLVEIYYPILKNGYKIIIVNKLGEGEDYYRTIMLDNKENRELVIADYISKHIEENNLDSSHLLFIGSNEGCWIAPQLALSFRVPKVILINPMYQSLETNFAFISMTETHKQAELDTLLGLEGNTMIEVMEKVMNPNSNDLVIGGKYAKYWKSYLSNSPGTALEMLNSDITVIQFTDYPFTSTMDKNKIKELSLRKEWRFFFEPKPQNTEERTDIITNRIKSVF